MALPIIAQPSRIRTNNFDGCGSFLEQSVRTKQSKPYNTPAQYTMNRVYTTSAKLFGQTLSHSGMANANAYKGDYLCDPVGGMSCTVTEIDQAINSARSKLVDSMNEQALWAVNYAQRRMAIDMMYSRVQQLLLFSRRLRRGDFNGAAHALGVRPDAGIQRRYKFDARKDAKDYGNAWLEYHFGWEPLIKDIGNTIDILQQPVPGGVVSVKGRKIEIEERFFQTINNSFKEYQIRELKGSVRAKAGVEFYVTDSDAYLANRMGFVSPLGVVWELIPYSFVIDWFTNVGDFLNQWSDFVGLTLRNPWYGYTMHIGSSRYEYHYTTGGILHGQEVLQTGLYSRRMLGMPGVTLNMRPPKRLSVVRAATAISLLVKFLKNPR